MLTSTAVALREAAELSVSHRGRLLNPGVSGAAALCKADIASIICLENLSHVSHQVNWIHCAIPTC